MRIWQAITIASVGIAGLSPASLSAQPVFNPSTGHYYEYVQMAPAPTWYQALEVAREREFFGQRGYLATITSETENAFLTSQFSLGRDSFFVWFGGVNITPTAPGELGEWFWGDGPEGGQHFSEGGSPVGPDNYVNWGGIEPNGNRFTMFNLGNSFAEIETGEWADAEAMPSELDPVFGYLVEYGGPRGKHLQTFIPPRSSWRYLDDGSDQGTVWRSITFDDDADWKQGIGEFGYGDGDETTVIDFGPNPNNKFVTTYFRHEFTLGAIPPPDDQPFDLAFVRDDAVAIYLNGFEVYRDESLSPIAAYNELANYNGAGAVPDESVWHSIRVEPDFFVSGRNVIAVEVHQAAFNSSDISFDLSLSTFVASVPEPSTEALLPLALATLFSFGWRRKKHYDHERRGVTFNDCDVPVPTL